MKYFYEILINGKPISEELAGIINIQTSYNHFDLPYEYHQEYYDIPQIHRGSESKTYDYLFRTEDGRESLSLTDKKVGYLELSSSLINDNIVADFYPLKHYWCDWNGEISFSCVLLHNIDFNHLINDLNKLAKKYPFLDMWVQVNITDKSLKPSNIIFDARVCDGFLKPVSGRKIIKRNKETSGLYLAHRNGSFVLQDKPIISVEKYTQYRDKAIEYNKEKFI